MKPHGLVVRDGEGCRSPGIDRIPALLTDSSSYGDLGFFRLWFFVTSVIFWQGVG